MNEGEWAHDGILLGTPYEISLIRRTGTTFPVISIVKLHDHIRWTHESEILIESKRIIVLLLEPRWLKIIIYRFKWKVTRQLFAF